MVGVLVFPFLVAAIYGLLTLHVRVRGRRALPAGPLQLAPTFHPPPPPPPPRATTPVPTPAPPAWAPLATDAAEQALLATLRDDPDDAAARLVYGDWLESHGQLARAQLVRGAVLTPAERAELATVDPAWRAIASSGRPVWPHAGSPLAPVADDEPARELPPLRPRARDFDLSDLGR